MWFLQDLGRLNHERGAVEALASANQWLDGVRWHHDGSGIAIDADIVLGDGLDHRYSVQLRFPEHYPSVLPAVRPKKPERWSSHQYGSTGDLCLELGPDNWHPDTHNAAHLLESTYRLLTLESENDSDVDETIPSRHELTVGQALRAQFLRWVVTPDAKQALDALPVENSVRCELCILLHESTMTVFLQRLEHRDRDDWIDPGVPSELTRLGHRSRGVVVTEPQGVLTLASLDDPKTVTSILERQTLPEFKDNQASSSLDAIEFVLLKGFHDEWQAHWRWKQGDKVSMCSPVDADTTSPDERHGLEADVLKDTTVVIVGLGSAGSKIATSLTRSGVGHFVLLDDDLLHPSNLVRHDSDWFEVGQHKVDAVADRMMLINPAAKIARRKHRLKGQESSTSAAGALTLIGQADLIIDATANPAVFNLCAHVARHSKKPLLWLEIYAGGIGGLVARTRPDKDAEPFTLRSAINAAANDMAEEKGVEPPSLAQDYAAMDADDRVVIATDADVSVMAAHACQMALDTALAREPSHYPNPAYLVGFARSWIFDQPFHVQPIDCSSDPDWSTVVHTDKATRAEASAFLVELFEEQTGDADTKST